MVCIGDSAHLFLCSMDLRNCSVFEFRAILDSIPGELVRRESIEQSRVRIDLERLAASRGLSFDRMLEEVAQQF
jgi:hypothetical protein